MPRLTEPRTVVVGYDGSDAARAGIALAAEAAGTGGRVVVVTSLPRTDAPELERGLTLVEDPGRLLWEAEELLRPHAVEVTTRVEEGDPARVLASAAWEADADLIVVGARGSSYLARALRGSVAERLVARAPCALLVAR